MNFLDIAQTPSNGLEPSDIVIAVVGVAIVVIIGVVALLMSKGKNGK